MERYGRQPDAHGARLVRSGDAAALLVVGEGSGASNFVQVFIVGARICIEMCFLPSRLTISYIRCRFRTRIVDFVHSLSISYTHYRFHTLMVDLFRTSCRPPNLLIYSTYVSCLPQSPELID